jgi:phytanoyl-CoA hydroxylase
MHDGVSADDRVAMSHNRRGYVVVPDVLGPEGLASAITEATAICRGMRGEIEGAVPAGERDDDDAVLRRYLCSDFPHKVSALMRDLACHPTVVDALVDVIGLNVKLMQSMLFIKAGRKAGPGVAPGRVAHPHVRPVADAVWLVLDDATVDNGCLWVLPGSDRRGVLYPTRDRPDARFDGTPEAHGFRTLPARPYRSSSRRARCWSSTATCYTARCPTAPRGRGGPW